MSEPTEDPPSAHSVKGVAFRSIAILFGLLIGLALGEALLRLIDTDARQQTKRALQPDNPRLLYHCYDSNPHGEMQALPDITSGHWVLHDYNIPPTKLPLSRLPETPHCIEYRLNEIELRERAVSLRPAPDKIRVALLGDSFVFGEGVPMQLTLSRQLQTELGDRFEVLNTGLPGLNNEEETQRLGDVVETLDPAWVIIVWLINDLSMGDALHGQQNFIHDLVNVRARDLDSQTESAWWASSRVLRLVGSWLALRSIRRQTIEWYRKTFDPEHNQDGLSLFAHNLERMSRCAGKRCAMVLYPLMQDLDADYPFADIHQNVARQVEALGMPVLDLVETFEGQDTDALRVHRTDHHPNGKAHAMAAKRIAQWLKNDVPGFWPAR